MVGSLANRLRSEQLRRRCAMQTWRISTTMTASFSWVYLRTSSQRSGKKSAASWNGKSSRCRSWKRTGFFLFDYIFVSSKAQGNPSYRAARRARCAQVAAASREEACKVLVLMFSERHRARRGSFVTPGPRRGALPSFSTSVETSAKWP